MTGLGPVRLAGAALIATSATVWVLAGTASATHVHAAALLQSGDGRATAHPGNATTCHGAGLSGVTLTQGDLEGKGYAAENDSRTTVTISRLPVGVILTAIVVKGGPAYNVYQPGERGLGTSLPYTDLRSPTNRGGNIPTISHWFACGTQVTPPGDSQTTHHPTRTPPICGNGRAPGGDSGSPCSTHTKTTPPPTCGNGGMSGGDSGSPCRPSCATGKPEDSGSSCEAPAVDNDVTAAPSTHARAVEADTRPASPPKAKNLAQTGFNAALPTGLAAILLLVGGLMVIMPTRTKTLVRRLRHR